LLARSAREVPSAAWTGGRGAPQALQQALLNPDFKAFTEQVLTVIAPGA
jgi:hypothetical protein